MIKMKMCIGHGFMNTNYHSNKEFTSDRMPGSISHRWKVIQESVSKFTGYLCQIENRRQSGVSQEDKIMQARTMYKEETKRAFQMLHYWNLLRHQQKWIDRRGFLESNKSGNKRQRAIEEVSPSQNVSSDVGEATMDKSLEYSVRKRPPGRKIEKLAELKRRRQEERMAKFWEKKEEVDMKKDFIRKDKFDEFMALERERFKHKKQIDEDVIMMMDTSSILQEPGRNYGPSYEQCIIVGKYAPGNLLFIFSVSAALCDSCL